MHKTVDKKIHTSTFVGVFSSCRSPWSVIITCFALLAILSFGVVSTVTLSMNLLEKRKKVRKFVSVCQRFHSIIMTGIVILRFYFIILICKKPFDIICCLYKLKQSHWFLCIAKSCDWSRKTMPLSHLTRIVSCGKKTYSKSRIE